MTTPRPRKQTDPLIIFLVIAFAMGWTFQLLMKPGPEEDLWLFFAMWSPMIAVLALGRRGFDVFLSLSSVRFGWCCIGAALGVLPFVFQQLCLWLFGLGSLNTEMVTLGAAGISRLSHARYLLGNGEQSWLYFTFNLLATIAVGGVMTTLLSGLPSEIGWRGFLWPRLTARFGARSGSTLVAVVAAVWLLPLACRMGVSEAALTSIGLLGFGAALGWLRARSGAIWPCAVAVGFSTTTATVHLVQPATALSSSLLNMIGFVLIGALCALGLRAARNR